MAKTYLESLLGEQEKIVLTSRQHWFILARSIFLEITLILIIFVSTITAALLFPPFSVLIAGVGFILLLIPVATMTRDILVWTNRLYIVTNRRVMQIAGFLNKNVTDSSLEKVNDVKMVQTAMGRLFGYGDIAILTASELGINSLGQIEDPIRFKTAMLNAKERLEHGEDRAPRKGDIPAMITWLDELRQQGVLSNAEFQQKKAELLKKL